MKVSKNPGIVPPWLRTLPPEPPYDPNPEPIKPPWAENKE